MSNEELKKKICEVISPYLSEYVHAEDIASAIAEALIEAKLVWDISALVDGKEGIFHIGKGVMLLYCEADVRELERRAKVAERAVENLSYKRAKILLYDDSKTAMEKIKQAELRQAEKELAEEKKDDNK